jgi:hypothetical protein
MAESRTESHAVRIALSWLVVGAPLLWGVYETLKKTAQLFQ